MMIFILVILAYIILFGIWLFPSITFNSISSKQKTQQEIEFEVLLKEAKAELDALDPSMVAELPKPKPKPKRFVHPEDRLFAELEYEIVKQKYEKSLLKNTYNLNTKNTLRVQCLECNEMGIHAHWVDRPKLTSLPTQSAGPQ